MTRALLIAEAGVNHNGSIAMALQLVDAAKQCGADAVKFQSFRADRLASPHAHKASYQQQTTDSAESQRAMLERLELNPEAHRQLLAHCRGVGIQFLSSPFDFESADLLAEIGVALVKIPSGEITNLPFLRHIARLGRPMILSTGMSTLGEVEEAVATIQSESTALLTLLHCVTEYPAPYDEINLRAMQTLAVAFGLPVGYSDHTPGIEVSVAAVALGAQVIEKHLTLDCNLPGPDHRASLEPAEFAQMVTSIRRVEAALGSGIKAPARCELPNRAVARKSIVAARSLAAGDRIAAADLTLKRPGHGLPPKLMASLIGRTLRLPVEQEELLDWSHLL
jgi:N,N'-diacetyllegionaminate synthase